MLHRLASLALLLVVAGCSGAPLCDDRTVVDIYLRAFVRKVYNSFDGTSEMPMVTVLKVRELKVGDGGRYCRMDLMMDGTPLGEGTPVTGDFFVKSGTDSPIVSPLN